MIVTAEDGVGVEDKEDTEDTAGVLERCLLTPFLAVLWRRGQS